MPKIKEEASWESEDNVKGPKYKDNFRKICNKKN